jgi:hypothetical protein
MRRWSVKGREGGKVGFLGCEKGFGPGFLGEGGCLPVGKNLGVCRGNRQMGWL